MQQKDKERAQKMSRDQMLKQKELMKEPINKFINAKDKDGKIKFPIAEKMRSYHMAFPDAVLKDIRMALALYHEVLWRKRQTEIYLDNWERKTEVDVRDKYGLIMEKEECYLAYLSMKVNTQGSLTSLRSHLISQLLDKCDGHIMTLDQFNGFVLEMSDKLTKEGFELFPDKIEVPKIE